MKRNNSELYKGTDWVFLTHTVQMKPDVRLSKRFSFKLFLTHTVQMKPSLDSLDELPVEDVLNPHGSDETQRLSDRLC